MSGLIRQGNVTWYTNKLKEAVMRTFHHFGIPTDQKHENETYVADAGAYITDFEKSPNRIEWVRWEETSTMPKLMRTVPHIAYSVEDLNAELEGKDLLVAPFEPLEGVTVAFIIEEGAPIELMQMAN
jgi:hypothetical protein